jgi:hypothetical protein
VPSAGGDDAVSGRRTGVAGDRPHRHAQGLRRAGPDGSGAVEARSTWRALIRFSRPARWVAEGCACSQSAWNAGASSGRRRSPATNDATAADSVAASTAPVIRSRAPLANSISITPDGAGSADAETGSGDTVTAAKVATGSSSRWQSSCRHRNNWLTWIPASRATADATAPRSDYAATIRCFSTADQRRRRCTDVITSTRPFVIVTIHRISHITSRPISQTARRPSPGAYCEDWCRLPE